MVPSPVSLVRGAVSGEDPLDPGEGVLVDERSVPPLVLDAAVADRADVVGVSEDAG
jgi:hypothetical protein